MKVAIYETVHLDWILPLSELLKPRSEEVSFFTNPAFEIDIKGALKEDYHRFQWFYARRNTNRLAYFLDILSFFNSRPFDYIILNSVDSRHLLLYTAVLKQQGKVFINIHDVNNFFNISKTPGIKTFLKTRGKRLLHSRASGFIVNAKSMKDYIESNQFTNKPVFWIPPVVSKADSCKYHSQKTPVSIVIPGSIDERRRDYETVLNVFEKIHQQIPDAITITLAGRPVGSYGQSIINRAKVMKEKGMKIKYSDQEIAEIEFQHLISSCDLLLSPLKEETSIHDNIIEHYGTSKMSGNIYDAIRHGKPLLVPSHLIVPNEIKTNCLLYNSESNLLEHLLNILNGTTDLYTLSVQAYINSQAFTLERTNAKLDLLLKE